MKPKGMEWLLSGIEGIKLLNDQGSRMELMELMEWVGSAVEGPPAHNQQMK